MFSELQKQKAMHLFNALDINKNGKLQLDDFVHVAKEILKLLGKKKIRGQVDWC